MDISTRRYAVEHIVFVRDCSDIDKIFFSIESIFLVEKSLMLKKKTHEASIFAPAPISLFGQRIDAFDSLLARSRSRLIIILHLSVEVFPIETKETNQNERLTPITTI